MYTLLIFSNWSRYSLKKLYFRTFAHSMLHAWICRQYDMIKFEFADSESKTNNETF